MQHMNREDIIGRRIENIEGTVITLDNGSEICVLWDDVTIDFYEPWERKELEQARAEAIAIREDIRRKEMEAKLAELDKEWMEVVAYMDLHTRPEGDA